MPTYDYICSACGHAFEQFQDMSAKKLRTCPKCKKPALERQVGAGAGLIFKGSGFYITDYKRGGATGPEKSADGPAACVPPPGGCGQPACPATPDAAAGAPASKPVKSASKPAGKASKKG